MLTLDEEDYELLTGQSAKLDLHDLKKERLFQNYTITRDPVAYKEYMRVYMQEWRKLNPTRTKEIAAKQRANPDYRKRQNAAAKKRRDAKRGTKSTTASNT